MIFERYLRQYAKWFASYDRQTWNYEDACVLIGLLDMYNATSDEFWWSAIEKFMDRYIEDDGTIRLYDMKEYNIDRVPGGRLLFPLYQRTGLKKYKVAIETLAQQMREHPRAKCGNYWHKKIYPNQIWLDGLYMGLPFRMLYARQFGDDSIYSDTIMQFKNVREHLFDEKAKLYYHAWDESRSIFWCDKETGLSPNFWSRAIGWYLMALADVYELMPKDRKEDRETLEKITMMVSYSIFKGIRLGVFPASEYSAKAEKAIMGTITHKLTYSNDKLSLGGMCKGAGLGPDGNFKRDGSVAYYLAEEVVADEQKGTGVSMMAYSEYLLAQKLGTLDPAYPDVELFKRDYDPILPTDPGFKDHM